MKSASISELRNAIQDGLSPDRLSLRRDSGGALLVKVVSAAFEGCAAREDKLRNVLESRGMGLPPSTLTTLLAPSELEDDADIEALLIDHPSVPTWSDALRLEPGLDVDERPSFGAHIVVFWGVKGGVGRSTAMANVAHLLDRDGLRVVCLDLDLDAASLVATWANVNDDRPRFDDVLVQAATADDETFASLVRRALRPATEISGSFEILGPAFVDEAFVHSLLSTLGPRTLYRGPTAAIHRLVQEVVRQTEADVVLVDARSGYCEESAIAVLDLADGVALFASAAPSTYRSLEPAWLALERCHVARGRPSQIHLILGMQPANEHARSAAREEAVAIADAAREKVATRLGVAMSRLTPDVEPIGVEYTARIVENDGHVTADTQGFVLLAERIRETIRPSMPQPVDNQLALKEMREAEIPVPQAEDERDPTALARLFTRTPELERFARPEHTLVLGAKGTGKTYLRRICLELPALVRALFERFAPSVSFVDAFSLPRGAGMARPEVTGDIMKALDRNSGDGGWSELWSAISIARVLAAERAQLPDHEALPAWPAISSVIDAPSSQARVTALEALAQRALDLDDAWKWIDRSLDTARRSLVLFFDDLDVALGQTKTDIDSRGRLIVGLFDRMEKSWAPCRNLHAKILLREDLLTSLGIEESAKYRSRAVVLKWEPDDIWRLVVRAMAYGSQAFRDLLAREHIAVHDLETLGTAGWEAPLKWTWGERMGAGESATRTLAWVQKRLRDGKERLFPRAALWLLKEALRDRRARSDEPGGSVIDAVALRNAMPDVAASRLAELQSECSVDEWERVLRLKKLDSYADRDAFERHLREQRDPDPKDALRVLNDLGVIEFGERRNRTPTVRIVDLYAFAPELEVKRLGRR